MNTLMNSRRTTLAALLVAASGAAHAGTDLRLDRWHALNADAGARTLLAPDANPAGLKISAEVQARYAYNERDGISPSDDETTVGFSLRRTRVAIEGRVTDSIKGKVKLAMGRKDGVADLEEAYADWSVDGGLTLRIGQFKQSLLREEIVSSTRQLTSERSSVNAAFTHGYSQGIQARWGDDSWRVMVGLSDGRQSTNSAYNADTEADYALNARFELRLGDADWDRFKQFTSWRGDPSGALLGAAIAHQSAGDTNPADPAGSSDTTSATVDFSWVGDGWNLYGAGIWRNTSPATGSDADDYGILFQGGFFVSDRDELFGRYETLLPDDSNAPNDEDFSALTVGWNHYFIPESHSAKFTLELLYALDATTTTAILSPSDGRNLLASPEDGQLGVTAQFQFMF